MKYLYIFCLLALFSCKQKVDQNLSDIIEQSSEHVNDSISKSTSLKDLLSSKEKNEKSSNQIVIDLQNNEKGEFFSDYYVVVADTGKNYHFLNETMHILKAKYDIEIDSMGRYYDEAKDKIIIPLDDDDEIWAGEYLAKRSETKTLSIEYLTSYRTPSKEKTLAVIGGIYKDANAAIERAAIIKGFVPNVFVVKSSIYIGCIH